MRKIFNQAMNIVGIPHKIDAEVDDMAMLRLLARERNSLTLVPPIVMRDELAAGILVEHFRLDSIEERFYAIVSQRRFKNPLLRLVVRADEGESDAMLESNI